MREDRQVSVVVPHYGDPSHGLALVQALRAQVGVDLQVVVVDDRSPEPFPDTAGVEVVRRAVNGGFGSAVNSGVAVARHPLVLVLNSDVTIGPTFVSELLDATDPWQPVVAGPFVRRPDGAPEWTARHFPTALHQTVEWLTPLARFRHHRVLHEAVGHDTRAVEGAVLPVDWLVGAALLVPTAAFRDVGGFDERYFMNSEEVDLQRRLREHGVPSLFVGTVALGHVGGGSSDPDKRRRWLVASRLTYAERWGGRRRLVAALAAATAVNVVVNTGRRLAGRDVDPVGTARSELGLLRGERR